MSHIDQITYSVFAQFDLELSAQWGIIGKKLKCALSCSSIKMIQEIGAVVLYKPASIS